MDGNKLTQQSGKRKLWKIVGWGVVAFTVAAAVLLTLRLVLINDEPVITGSLIESAPVETIPVVGGELSSRILFSGTVVTARAVENEARMPSGEVEWAQVFSQFNTFNPEQYDEWIIDMECPVTTNDIPYRTQVQNTVFNCPPTVFPEMSKYFTVANIANNHTRDQGDAGFTESRESIIEGGLQSVGHWDPRESADACEVTAMTVTIDQNNDGPRKAELPVALCAFHHFEKPPTASDFDIISEYAGVMPVIGLMQVGAEYRASSDARQQEVGRALIDAGAEFVVGNSPHWVQETDVYKDKLIVYSTGNFIFDQLDDETNRGLSLDVSVSAELDQNILDWAALAESCKPELFKDDCLVQANTSNLQKMNLTYEFDIVGSSGGYRQLTQLASNELQRAIEKRADWTNTLQKLGQ